MKSTEKLIKERVKELEEENKKLTAESTEREEKTYYWQDRAEELQDRINKAIEYIEENEYGYMNEYALERFRNNLLKILKGE